MIFYIWLMMVLDAEGACMMKYDTRMNNDGEACMMTMQYDDTA